MDTFFGRKKSRPRQSSASTSSELRSVPYESVSAGSPPPVSGSSQGFRRNLSNISAPVTNPTLSADGTELNVHAMQRVRSERERTYASSNATSTRSNSPHPSVVTDDSSTLVSESAESPSKLFNPATHRVRTSESLAGRASLDFGQPYASPHASRSFVSDDSAGRPSSQFTRSDNRSSRFLSTITGAGAGSELSPQSGHSHHFPHLHRHSHSHDDFYFPRPEDDAEIEALFENLKMARDLGPLPDLSMDQKWRMVEGDERIRWNEERNREQHAKKQLELGKPASVVEGTPEWYLKKFLDKTITAKQASNLLVSLRSRDIAWFRQFVAIQGTSVLATTLAHLSRKGTERRENDNQLEYEIVRPSLIFHVAYAPIFMQDATKEALTHNGIVAQLASALNSPRIVTKKLLIELLINVTYWQDGEALPLVFSALEALSVQNGCAETPYAYWFKSLESVLSGRGKMGSLVGASDEVRKNAGTEGALNEYALFNMILINGIIACLDDLDLRLHHRSLMDAAGLQRIIQHCRAFGYEQLDTQLEMLEERLEADEQDLRDRLDQDILRDMNSLEDVYGALRARTDDSKAHDYFLSMMQHLLLIRDEGPGLVHYFQLLDSLVTDVVMDKKLGGVENRFGQSVERIIGQFNDADRSHIEKELLEEELAKGGEGLVGQLKATIAQTEGKLEVSQENTLRLQERLEQQKLDYEERIAQLEAQILELFRMLREVGKGVDQILDTGGSMDRQTLMDTLEKHLQRIKTIDILEGRDDDAARQPRRKKSGTGFGSDSETDEGEGGPSGSSSLRRKARSKNGVPGSARASEVINGRGSQFMDADEADVREQIQQQLAAGATAVCVLVRL
ncbi:hypothetical protein EWM64_g7645 [Hericium alpestre]|uniref:GBD/FH3 domain-containing protein n=1 Tax=Hericium alpestre TaxID=135208 RepID=A0A4Y9ZNC3_9AGAM|nr:hypothetical protein EWM64_g7645 [Hericium alpestre]